MEEIVKLIKLIVDQDMEGLRTLDEQISEQVVRLNNTLKSFSITLSTLEKCGLNDCEEYSLIITKWKEYDENLKAYTDLLLKIRKAIAELEKELNT